MAIPASTFAVITPAPPTGGRPAGSITAAMFLKEFVDGVPWAHIDIAGPSFNTGSPYGYNHKQGTGSTVRTLVAYVEDILAKAV